MASIFSGKQLKMPDVPGLVSDAPPPKPRPRPVLQPVVQALPPPPPPKKETPFVMEIITGTKKAESKFDANGEGK